MIDQRTFVLKLYSQVQTKLYLKIHIAFYDAVSGVVDCHRKVFKDVEINGSLFHHQRR